MNEPRIAALADLLVDHSCRVKAGDRVLIETFDLPRPDMVCALVERVRARGGHPILIQKDNRVLRTLYRTGDADTLRLCGEWEGQLMAQVQCYIGIRGALNNQQFADVPQEQLDLYQQHWWHPVHSLIRVPHTRWVVLRWPTDAMAQSASMSTEAFEDFYFSVVTADYAQMQRNFEPLVARMLKAERVRLTAPGTDLRFSIKDMKVRPCFGQRNIPDGECFTVPVRDSVEGTVAFNAPSLYQGTVFEGITLSFKQGKVVEATCRGQTAKLNHVLDSDEGARYLGEWSLGCNNRVRKPMLDTLFDEKIGGSLHMALGNAYQEADNGNRSRIHWDLVLIQTPEFGGGEVWLDEEVVRRDGRFLPADLQPLNEGL